MPKRPDSLRIGALTYRIEWISADTQVAFDAYGACTGASQVIHVSGGLSPDRLAVVFLHEIIHAIAAQQVPSNSEDDEYVAKLPSFGLVDVFRSNPEVWEWWSDLMDKVAGGE